MSYLVFARKYRPVNFKEVVGQQQVTKPLLNSIKRDMVGHAYLFSGPRGVGKTSIARIFSKALNCSKPIDFEPCDKCSNCIDITKGKSLAVREIDGASNNSVDNVRDLIDSFKTLPPTGYKYKIYIIDEVHMLSTSAFNALLKSLEEPPANTIFILATTDPQKVIPTVISRCQRHEFRTMSSDEISISIEKICADQKITIDKISINIIARLADGSLRDSLSILERLVAYCDKEINSELTTEVLGLAGVDSLKEIAKAIFNNNSNDLIENINLIFSKGVNCSTFLSEISSFFRELLFVKASTKKLAMFDEAVFIELKELTNDIALVDIQDITSLVLDATDRAIRSSNPRYFIEASLIRISQRLNVVDLLSLINGSSLDLEKKNLKQA